MNEKRIRWKALANRVLVVAHEGNNHDWAAYIDAVSGQNHDKEWEDVLKHGTKLSRNFAELLFPDFAKDLDWRS